MIYMHILIFACGLGMIYVIRLLAYRSMQQCIEWFKKYRYLKWLISKEHCWQEMVGASLVA